MSNPNEAKATFQRAEAKLHPGPVTQTMLQLYFQGNLQDWI